MAIIGKIKTLFEDKERTQAIFPRTHAKAVTDLIDTIYPVGSIYMSVNSISPATLFGGTWEQIAQGRTLIGVGRGYDVNGNAWESAVGTMGGEYFHTLTVDEMPSHTHSNLIVSAGKNPWGMVVQNSGNAGFVGEYTSSVGGSQPHNNMPPYLAVYMWKRTA